MNPATIQHRAAAREQARVAAGLVVEEAGKIPQEAQAAFWDEIRKALPFPQPTPIQRDEPFSDRQAKCFGATKMPFGKFAGNRVDDVPLDYLEKLCDPQPFIRSLKRYIASTRILIESRDANYDE